MSFDPDNGPFTDLLASAAEANAWQETFKGDTFHRADMVTFYIDFRNRKLRLTQVHSWKHGSSNVHKYPPSENAFRWLQTYIKTHVIQGTWGIEIDDDNPDAQEEICGAITGVPESVYVELLQFFG